jgi:hypothetical protein
MISPAHLSTAAGAAAELVRAAASEAQPAAAAGSPLRSVATASRVVERGATRGDAAGLTGASRALRSAGRASSRPSSRAGWAADAAATARASMSRHAKASSATGTGKAPASRSSANDPLAFLRDSKLSIEEKLMRLLAHLNAQWEKDMQKKLDAFRGPSESSATSKGTGASAGKKSLLQTVAGAAKQFLPGVGFALDALGNPTVRAVATKIGGPVLAAAATAMGFPVLAPALLKYAPAVIDLAAGAASALGGGGSPATKSSAGSKASGSSSGSKANGGTAMSASEQQLAFMEIQHLREKQKEMFTMVSNILKSGHDLRMGIISNLR